VVFHFEMEEMMEKTKAFCLIAFLAVSTLLLSAVCARAVSDEARRHMDRGQAAIEMANTPADLDDAAKEFQKAIELAPRWPDPYYNLGMVQNKMERYDDALKNLKSYLQLAPNAKDAQEVKQLVNKIEYKLDKEGEVKKAFELLGSQKKCKLVSQENSDDNWKQEMGIVNGFMFKDGVLGIENWLYFTSRQDIPSFNLWSRYVQGRPEWSPWVPVHINGRTFEYSYVYVVPTIHKRKNAFMVVETRGKGEIISLDPIRTKTMVKDRQTMIILETGEAERWDSVATSEIVEECHAE
jgi:hypothetical protein